MTGKSVPGSEGVEEGQGTFEAGLLFSDNICNTADMGTQMQLSPPKQIRYCSSQWGLPLGVFALQRY